MKCDLLSSGTFEQDEFPLWCKWDHGTQTCPKPSVFNRSYCLDHLKIVNEANALTLESRRFYCRWKMDDMVFCQKKATSKSDYCSGHLKLIEEGDIICRMHKQCVYGKGILQCSNASSLGKKYCYKHQPEKRAIFKVPEIPAKYLKKQKRAD